MDSIAYPLLKTRKNEKKFTGSTSWKVSGATPVTEKDAGDGLVRLETNIGGEKLVEPPSSAPYPVEVSLPDGLLRRSSASPRKTLVARNMWPSVDMLEEG